jgi:hypothetical protein
VIVGGDSDFIALVEKLKQYDKMVFVVGGRSFTSSILQKNCHEFIAYENLIGIRPAARKAAGRAPSPSTAHMRDALPQLRRALEILADREVSPQLGLLKSTLLQLDSTFSERDYGARSFREFIQKMADAGYVTLKDVDGSLLVEMKYAESVAAPAPAPAPEAGNAQVPEADEPPPREPAEAASHQADALSIVRRIVEESGSKAHWPMYLRSFRHFLRAGDPSFDERRYGFGSTHDLVRQAQREGMLRVERNRQGILRIFPPEIPPPQVQDAGSPEPDVALQPAVIPSIEEAAAADQIPPPETPAAAPEAVPEDISLQGALRFAEGPVVEEKPRRRRSARTPSAAGRRKPAARRLKAAKQDSEPA